MSKLPAYILLWLGGMLIGVAIGMEIVAPVITKKPTATLDLDNYFCECEPKEEKTPVVEEP